LETLLPLRMAAAIPF